MVAPKPPLLQLQCRRHPSENPNAETSLTNPAATSDGMPDIATSRHRRKRKLPRRAMENFTTLVMKFASSDSTGPLTSSRKAFIEKRLPEIFPDFHTPDHPPYAAMIHGAIAELKEQEGSSEESISEFIRKEYKDLPWAHVTLLKHHLQKLCESGEIVLTSDRCYLLSDGVSSLYSGPCSSPMREPMPQMQKRRGKKLRGQARWHGKEQIKEQNQPEGEQMEVIQGQNQAQEQHNLVIEEQNLAEEQNELIEELNVLQAREQEKPSGLIGKLQEQQLPESSPDFCCQQKNPVPQLEIMTTTIDFPIKAKQPQVEQQLEHPYPEVLLCRMTRLLPAPTSITPLELGTDSHLLEQEQQPELSNSEGPLELCRQQKASKSLPMTSPNYLTLPLNSEPPDQCKLELPNSGRFLDVQMTTEEAVGEFSETCILQPILEESTQQEGQRAKLHGRQKQFTSQAETRTDSLDSPLASQREPEQQPEFPSPERAEEQQHQHGQENPQCRQLQSRCTKSEAAAAAATTTAELASVLHQHEELQQPGCQDRGRPLKRKSDMTSTVGESSSSDHQGQREQHRLALRGRGRPRKYPHNPRQHGCGRPPKHPHNPQQQQPQEQTKLRRQGKPRKLKPDYITENFLPSEKQLQETKCQGPGRPRKLDEGK